MSRRKRIETLHFVEEVARTLRYLRKLDSYFFEKHEKDGKLQGTNHEISFWKDFALFKRLKWTEANIKKIIKCNI